MSEAPRDEIDRLALVYDADWTALGMLRYAVNMVRGDTCALCDITHGGVREKPAWKGCRTALGVQVDGLYRNQLRDPAIASAVGGQVPCILAHSRSGWQRLLDGAALATCSGSVGALQEALHARAKAAGLRFP